MLQYINKINFIIIIGSRICHHGKYRHVCKQCGGSGICEHNKVKYSCAQCKGTSTKKKGVTSTNSTSAQPPNFEFPKESTEEEVLYTSNSSKDIGATSSILDNEKDLRKPTSDVSNAAHTPMTPFMNSPYVPMCYDTGMNMNMNPFNPMHLNMLMMMQGQNPFALNPAAGFPFNMNSFAFNPNAFAYNNANSQMMMNPQAMMAAQLMNSMNSGMQQTSAVNPPSSDENNTKK